MSAVPSDPLPGTPPEAAEAYASLGWRVVPIIPGRKHPGVDAWQKAATDDIDTIRSWFNGLYRGHGVGVACGSGSDIWVLDVDDVDSYNKLQEDIGPLPPTVWSRSGSGRGFHLFYQWDPDRPITNGHSRNLPPGIDVRGEGGQCVIPPTIHPNGQPYTWGADPFTYAVADAPDALYDLMYRAPDIPPRPPKVEQSDNSDSIAAWARTAYTFPDVLAEAGWTLTDTKGDDTYWARPGKAAREGHAGVLHGDGPFVHWTTSVPAALNDPLCATKDGTGWAFSLFGFIAATKHGGDRSQAARELRRERQRIEAAPVKPQITSTLTAAAEPADEDGGADGEADVEEEPGDDTPGKLVDLTPWLEGTIQAVEPDILPREDGQCMFYRGQLNWVHGDSGSGKTWLVLAAAQHEVATGGHVLWIHYEDPTPAAVTERLRSFGLSKSIIKENFHYWDPEGEGLIMQAGKILEYAAHLDADLIVIDSIGEALNADGRNEDSDAEVGPWIVSGPRAFVNAGHTFIGIDHGTKGAQAPLHPSGSKRKRASITGVGYLVEPVSSPTKDSNGILRIKCAKDRHGTYQQGSIVAMVHIDHVDDTLVITPKAPMSAEEQAMADQERLVRAVVREVERQPGLTANTLCKLMPGAQKTKQLAAIGVAVDQGLIRNLGTSSAMRLHPVDNPMAVEA